MYILPAYNQWNIGKVNEVEEILTNGLIVNDAPINATNEDGDSGLILKLRGVRMNLEQKKIQRFWH